jgi:hypothetical protein
VLNCGVICAISFTKTKTSSIDGRLQAGIAPFIEAELLAHNGWESQSQLTVTGSCDINNVAPCTRVFAQAHLTYELGRKAIMYHEWRLAGTWGGAGCPIAPPAIWYVNCGSGASQVIINIATTWGCDVLCADKCGDECDMYEGGLPE